MVRSENSGDPVFDVTAIPGALVCTECGVLVDVEGVTIHIHWHWELWDEA